METSDHYDFLLKFIIIGNSSTGKSCLLHYFLENKFKQNTSHTIGVEFGSKILQVGNKSIKLQIWDTAGQERFRSVSRSYYRGALGALILYDITNAETFEALPHWIKDARDLARSDICITVLGNKKDLSNERIISFVEGAKFSQENSVSFMETSVLTGENVEDAFNSLTKSIIDRIENGQLETNEIKPKIMTTIRNDKNNGASQKKCLGCN